MNANVRVTINDAAAWIPNPATHEDIITAAGVDDETAVVHFNVAPPPDDPESVSSSGAFTRGAEITLPPGVNAAFTVKAG